MPAEPDESGNERTGRGFILQSTERPRAMSNAAPDPKDPVTPSDAPPPVAPEMDPSRSPETPSYEPQDPQDPPL